jgi:hypothetical protein
VGYADAPRGARVAIGTAVGVGAVAVVGLLVWLLWGVFKGAKKVTEEAGRAAGNIATAAADVAETGGKSTVDIFDFLFQFKRPLSNADEYSTTRPTLKLAIVEHEEWGETPVVDYLPFVRQLWGGGGKRNRVMLKATDGKTGKPVMGATVVGVAKQVTYPSSDQQGVTGFDGTVVFDYQIPAILGQGWDDNVEFIAKRDGYNPSNKVLVD